MLHNTGDEKMEQSEQTCQATQSDTIGELAKAVCKMQKTKLFAITDSTNPFFNSKYSDLSSVWSAIREPLTDNGLSIIQTTDPYEDGVIVVTTLLHESGEWIRGRLAGTIVPDKKGHRTPQGTLSLITYLRRAGVSAITGVCPVDDDGDSVSGRNKSSQSTKTSPPSAQKKSTSLPGNVETDGLGKIKKPGDKRHTELDADEHVMVEYIMPSVDSVAFAQLKEYRPDVVIMRKDKTRFKVGKYIVETNADGSMMYSDIPKFGSIGFQMDACVPCLVAGLVRLHGVPFVSGKFDLKFVTEVDTTSGERD